MRTRYKLLVRWLLLALVMAWGGAAWAQVGNLAKIDPELQELMHQSRDANERFRVIVEMAEQYDNPNLERGTALMTRAQRRDYVVNELKRFSERSQTEVVSFLTAQGTRGQVNVLHRFWIFNGVCCEATAECIGELSMRQDVRFVSVDKEMKVDELVEVEERDGSNPPQGIQWHVSKVRADEVWNYPNTQGFTGRGVVVAIIDTGVNYDHSDISNNMWEGGGNYPNHGWDFALNNNDPKDELANSPKAGHGTHVAGIVAGDGASYKTGVAPDAKIMAIKIFYFDDQGELHGNESNMLAGTEFALEHGADVLNYSVSSDDGKGGISFVRDAMVNLLNAGVVAVAAAGNTGETNLFGVLLEFPVPYNVHSPGNCPPPWRNPNQMSVSTGDASAVICVGNTKMNDKKAKDSSIGPVTWAMGNFIGDYNDYPYYPEYQSISGLVRPDVSAPGTEIWSLAHNSINQYCKKSGTSMATPCVSGVIALMLEANPYLTPAKIDEILETTAVPCDGQSFKNNKYGAGRVDAYAAVTAALQTNMPQQYRISVSKFPFDCECAHVSGDTLYQPGELCTLQASPAEHFLHWEKEGQPIPGDATISFHVTENAQYTAVFDENVACYYINVADNPSGAAAGGSGWGHYYSGQTCTLTAIPNEGYVFSNWTKNGEEVSTNAEFSFIVFEDALYVANFKRWCTITTVPNPVSGGTVSGSGTYLSGDPCTLTATPNLGYAFKGWYNVWETICYSTQPEYTFTITQDRTLMAKFELADYTITLNASPVVGGTISGGGTYPAGSVVTVSAHANSGYRFNGWVENGEVVANSNSYMFTASADRNLTATFVRTEFTIGSLITNPDGSQGVVFLLSQDGTEGWMVALNDASEGCQWGENSNVLALQEVSFNSPLALNDVSGFRNTGILRELQGAQSGYAASLVDYENGWYLPSSGQLRKLYAALPFIEEAITAAGGTNMTDDAYWSSSEFSASDAFAPSFAMSNVNKTSNCRVRAIHNFVTAGNNVVLVSSNNNSFGTASVSGNGTFAYGASVTVTATPNAGYVFDHWSEDGEAVSYDMTYQFIFTHSRSLKAHFVVPGSVGSIVVNADGSKGVVFWLSPDGDEGLMVALEDASDGCQWGDATDALSLINKPFNEVVALQDISGNTNTRCIRKDLDTLSGNFAANVVDFEDGWYLPSVGELRKLYAALPLIETSLSVAGGNLLTEDTYWSSTEYSSSDAATTIFSMGNTNKTNTCRVRAIRHFAAAGPNFITAKPNNRDFGVVIGSGEYSYGQNVMLAALSNPGYTFNAWKENGMVVSYDSIYQFTFTRSRALVADFSVPGSVGSIVVNADGSKGVAFWLSPDGDEGLMVALEDASEGSQWGEAVDAFTLVNWTFNSVKALDDVSGNSNTRCIHNHQGTDNEYAASVVDFENGWYLPSVGELRKLYGALPMIETSLVNAGGSTLTEGTYWSSTEYSGSDAATASFNIGNLNKIETCRVRAIRHFATTGPNAITVKSNNPDFGTVTGSGEYTFGQNVVVTALPNSGYTFNAWTENGMIVSCDATYQFPFTRSRSLVANFLASGSVGSIVHNADGSTGVVFYTYPSGIGGLMVALEDDSEGCPWGLNEDVTILDNQSPSAVLDLLGDMSGKSNTNRVRQWYSDNPDFAACKTDYANGWYLPSAGQLRELYSALPMIEGAIVNLGGTTLTEEAYWSSTEQSDSNAWTPSFAMSSSSKTGNCRVRAIRSLTDTETIIANVNIEGGGTVTGAGWYDHGQTCTLKAQANESYAFLNWTHGGTVVSTNMEYSFTVLGNQTYTANFVANSSNITTAVEPANSGTVTGAGIYTIGSNCTLTATPHIGYSFVNWTKNGIVVSTNSSYSFTVAESAQYTAHFVINSYAVNATAFPEEGGTVAGSQTYTHGSTATLTATAAEGYTFINWTENGAVVSTSPTLQFVVYSNRTLVANFSDNAYMVTTIAYPSNGGTIEGGGAYIHGTTATLTAHPNPQFDFFCWFEDDDVLSFDPSVSFEVTENHVIYAVFVENEDIIQTVNLSEGWNWFSTYLDITLDDLKAALVSALPGTNISINSQSVGSTTYANNRWRGTLTALDLSQMYMINVTADCEMTLVGVPFDPSVHPVTIHPDFNWMAFPLSQGMTLTDVFQGFAVNGDMVISQAEGSSTYTNRWRGTLSTLEPGRGYMYKSTITVGDRVFTFPISTK